MALSVPQLLAVKTVVTHANCPDGIASALVVKHVLPNVNVRFVSYGTTEHEELPVEPGMLFVDFSPSAARAAEFVEAFCMVLDHHRTAKPVVEMFGDRGIFADETYEPGVCGAVLAYRHIWLPLAYRAEVAAPSPSLDAVINHFVYLSGVRDTFRRDSLHWEAACGQAEMLRFYPLASMLSDADGFFRTLDEREVIGKMLYEKRLTTARRLRDNAHRIEIEDKRILDIAIIPSTDTTDVADVFDEAVSIPDVIVGFSFFVDSKSREEKMVLSLRSHKEFDCAAFCKKLGGGGHKAAAGCTLTLASNDAQPYTFIADLFTEHA
jgi:oligoribonuclease NrnB/cAMP/cGMP phosphodiesterase (DHH superfamily)